MNNESEPQEQKSLNRYELFLVTQGIKYAAEALTEAREYAPSKITQAIRSLTEAINCISPVGTLTKEEANVSATLHTYLRKYEDGPLSCMLHSHVAEGRGVRVWIEFIKELFENGNYKRFGLHGLDRLDINTTDEYDMRHLLNMWQESGGLKIAIEQLKTWKCLKPLPPKQPTVEVK